MAGNEPLILCDIGNSRMHFYDESRVVHTNYEEGLSRYGAKRVYFICVNASVKDRIHKSAPAWQEIEGGLLPTAYEGLGVDREAACLGLGAQGIVIDAGSAITVDVMEDGRHRGGWIWPGIQALLEAYRHVSPRLDRPLHATVSLDDLPNDTGDAIAFGMLAPIRYVVDRFASSDPIVVTGGDAALVAHLLPQAMVDETVVFRGMKKMLKDAHC